MEIINYERFWTGFTTRCPYKRKIMVGSHECFFCHYCKGRTENTVKCRYTEINAPKNPIKRVLEKFSMDVMVKDEFRRTIFVKPTGLVVANGVLHKVLTNADIDHEVKARCPIVYKYEKWHVERNEL